MGYFIPETIKNIDNWLVWKKEKRNGKTKKVPYNPKTGRRTDPTKPCCSYDDAMMYLKYSGEYDGVGFTLTKDINITCIDLDNCIDESGEMSALAEEMTEQFKDSFIEISQSGHGLHIFCIGSIPSAKTTEIEIYSQGKYIAITGNAISLKEPRRAQEKLNDIFNRLEAKRSVRIHQNEPQSAIYINSKDKDEVISAILRSRQAEKWQKLNNGDIQGYPSRSEAAQAFIAITHAFTPYNKDLIKNIFLDSCLSKDDNKYTKDYYIDRMIENAINTFICSDRRISNKNNKRERVITKGSTETYQKQTRKRVRKI